jgi:hypothetical protein
VGVHAHEMRRPRLEIGLLQCNVVFCVSRAGNERVDRTRRELLRANIVRRHRQEIEIAVRPGVSPRFGPEKVDADRTVVLNQAPGDFFNSFLFGELRLHEPIRPRSIWSASY